MLDALSSLSNRLSLGSGARRGRRHSSSRQFGEGLLAWAFGHDWNSSGPGAGPIPRLSTDSETFIGPAPTWKAYSVPPYKGKREIVVTTKEQIQEK
jgi:hypothetical protein